MAKIYVTNNHSSDLEYEIAQGGQELIPVGETKQIDPSEAGQRKIDAEAHAGMISTSDKDPRKGGDSAKGGDTSKPTEATGVGAAGGVKGGS